jgi:hypothetical protein
MRKLLVTVATAAVTGAALLGAAGTAVAAESNAWVTHAASSFNAPREDAVRVDTFVGGEQVEALCFTEGQVVDGNPIWFRIEQNGEYRGFVHRDALGGVPTDLRHC